MHIAEKYTEDPSLSRQFDMRSEAVSKGKWELGVPQFPDLAVAGLVAFDGRGITELLLSANGKSHRPVVEMELDSISECQGSGWK